MILYREYSMNRLSRTAASAAAFFALAGLPALAQSVISAHSGLIHYAEGRVLLDGKQVEVKITAFPEIKVNMELRTEDGRVEVLLNPGVFLRMGENTAIHMVSNKLSDSQVEFLSGSAVVESSGDLAQKDDSVTILYKSAAVHLRKKGIYRFDSEPAQLRVFSGEAEVESASNVLIVRTGKMLTLEGAVAVEKFNAKEGDDLNRWSQRRAEYISMANISAAKYVKDSGSTWNSSGWYYNPYFGMFTFIPGSGMFYSPYGYRYYAPGTVGRVYYQPPVYTGSGYGSGYGYGSGVGYATAAPTSSGYSGAISSAPSYSSSGASTGAMSGGGGAAVSAPSGHAGGHSR